MIRDRISERRKGGIPRWMRSPDGGYRDADRHEQVQLRGEPPLGVRLFEGRVLSRIVVADATTMFGGREPECYVTLRRRGYQAFDDVVQAKRVEEADERDAYERYMARWAEEQAGRSGRLMVELTIGTDPDRYHAVRYVDPTDPAELGAQVLQALGERYEPVGFLDPAGSFTTMADVADEADLEVVYRKIERSGEHDE